MWNALWRIFARPDVLEHERDPQDTLSELERLIRPSGYFRQKAQRLKTFIAFLDQTLRRIAERNVFRAHRRNCAKNCSNLNGVGPETADSILLYAGNHPVFVVDAYTRRILERHEILPRRCRL